MAAAWLWEFCHRRRLNGAYPATRFPLPKVLLILLAALPFTSVAQQARLPETHGAKPRVFLSNAGKSPAGRSESVLAQGFITGHSSNGYRLGSIELFLETPPPVAPTRPVVMLLADDLGEPGKRVVSFRNPETFVAGANRFAAQFPVVLDARRAYHLLLNLGAEPPLAFGLVLPGTAAVLTGNGQWVAQSGSRTLLDTWEWRFDDGYALRFTLNEAGQDVSPPSRL